MLIMTFLMVQGQRSPCKMKVIYQFLYVINCNYSPICHRFRDIDLQSYQKMTIFYSLLGVLMQQMT